MNAKQPAMKNGGVASRPAIKERMSNHPKGSQFKANCYCGKRGAKK